MSSFSSVKDKENSKKEWVFIDESDNIISPAKQSHDDISDSNFLISIPFPPQINPLDLIRRNKNGQLLSRATNKFLIYRNEYSKELQSCGYKLSMRDVSRMAAKSWKLESSEVKRKYEDIAREVEKIHVKLSMSASPYPICCARKFSKQSNLPQQDNFFFSVSPSTQLSSYPSFRPHPTIVANAIRSPSVGPICSNTPISANSNSTYPSLYHLNQSENYNPCFPFELYNNPLNLQIQNSLLPKASTDNNSSFLCDDNNDLLIFDEI
ncbi:2536_t:CDS:1 [Acaulospora colombiana]|uniref:2536_t:CDS:1 n=1 Tax=Acaulospora colombiana TaxID=27376 RepID=A0ACA9LG14_9GLOM|nr:2536_t:CDS:1 [Acaulospora colombiana]